MLCDQICPNMGGYICGSVYIRWSNTRACYNRHPVGKPHALSATRYVKLYNITMTTNGSAILLLYLVSDSRNTMLSLTLAVHYIYGPLHTMSDSITPYRHQRPHSGPLHKLGLRSRGQHIGLLYTASDTPDVEFG